MIPNALVIAFDGRVSFESSAESAGPTGRFGELVIPIDDSEEESELTRQPLVDGQQRAAAIREARVEVFPAS